MDLLTATQHFDTVISKSKALIEDGSDVGSAALWALDGGKRLRPALMYLIKDALNSTANIDQAALALEMIHTSSLIADDLPSMDNDAIRRGKPSTHIQFSESTAYLASYRLMALGYQMLTQSTAQIIKDLKNDGPKRSTLALEKLCTKSMEMATGQFYDLQEESKISHSELMQLKTASLFQAAFSIAWLLCNGAIESIKDVEKAAYHFGLAFQLADDLCDAEDDRKHGNANWFNSDSAEPGASLFEDHMKKAEERLSALGLFNQNFKALLERLYSSVSCSSSLASAGAASLDSDISA